MNEAVQPGAPAGGGMKSAIKIIIPVFVLMAVIFGVTFFSQYTAPVEEKKIDGPSTIDEPPLRFASSTRQWDAPDFFSPEGSRFRGFPLMAPSAMPSDPYRPFRFIVQDRVFPAFYEVQSDAAGPKNSASFWFENPRPQSVTMRLQSVSCSACSGAAVAMIPPDVTRQLLQMSGISLLPQGLMTGLPVGMVGPGANLHPDQLRWEHHSFREDRHPEYKIAKADNTDGWSPLWGILKIDFVVGAITPKTLEARFTAAVEGTPTAEMYKFVMVYEGVNGFDLMQNVVDVGELSENSELRKFEILVYSSTRGSNRTGSGELGDLTAPTVSVRMPAGQIGDPGQFLEVGEPIRVPESDLPLVARIMADQTKKVVRVESAYRFPVTLRPKIGSTRIDIGSFERDIWFAVPGTQERQARVKGMVRGSVWLDNDSTSIDLGGYPGSDGFTKPVRLITAQPDLAVSLVPNECTPKFLNVKLEKDPNPPSRDRGYYKLTIRAPGRNETKDFKFGSWNGELVLEVKGPTPQRIRIPIKGRVDIR